MMFVFRLFTWLLFVACGFDFVLLILLDMLLIYRLYVFTLFGFVYLLGLKFTFNFTFGYCIAEFAYWFDVLVIDFWCFVWLGLF